MKKQETAMQHPGKNNTEGYYKNLALCELRICNRILSSIFKSAVTLSKAPLIEAENFAIREREQFDKKYPF